MLWVCRILQTSCWIYQYVLQCQQTSFYLQLGALSGGLRRKTITLKIVIVLHLCRTNTDGCSAWRRKWRSSGLPVRQVHFFRRIKTMLLASLPVRRFAEPPHHDQLLLPSIFDLDQFSEFAAHIEKFRKHIDLRMRNRLMWIVNILIFHLFFLLNILSRWLISDKSCV